ncbi:MAG: acylphosphatase [Candidatus Aenigmarchaeota archaeon]|nr:acylphosphatase [Candidatus Aenigmarchaeota archaeon]
MVAKNIMIIVHGSVQSVSFRSFAKENADALNIRGYAKNLKDGTVKIVAEGDDQKLEEFIEKIKVGPPNAKVENVAIIERGYLQNIPAFETF